MPLSEFLRLAVEKLEAGKRKQSSTDLSSRSESDLGSPTPQMDLSRNDEIVPWFSYPIDKGPQNYGSEFLSEISGVTANVMSTQNSSVFGNCSHDNRDVVKESYISAKTENLCGEISIKNDRALEPVVDSSSVGSDTSANRVSCGQKRNSKRNFHDIEETIRDDIGTELIGVTKATTAGGRTAASKRSRVAEVHNLSERRRRDRINEKMRVLQELIPNCNKADKASMLDEAIEYLKNLQLQIQIMSMRAGLCMPPHMIFAQGNRHLYHAHLPHHFSPIIHPMQRALFPSSAPGPMYRHHSTSPKFDSRGAVENKNSECMHNTETNT